LGVLILLVESLLHIVVVRIGFLAFRRSFSDGFSVSLGGERKRGEEVSEMR